MNLENPDDDLSLKHLAYPPPIPKGLFAPIQKSVRQKSKQRLKRASTGLVLYQTLDIAQRVYDGRLPLRLPRELIGCPIVFLAGSTTSELEANVPYLIVGAVYDTIIAPYN
jgi:hypothetical protein